MISDIILGSLIGSIAVLFGGLITIIGQIISNKLSYRQKIEYMKNGIFFKKKIEYFEDMCKILDKELRNRSKIIFNMKNSDLNDFSKFLEQSEKGLEESKKVQEKMDEMMYFKGIIYLKNIKLIDLYSEFLGISGKMIEEETRIIENRGKNRKKTKKIIVKTNQEELKKIEALNNLLTSKYSEIIKGIKKELTEKEII
jgi:hypothetical protein